ncbi:uncharacterized protein LOC117105940, partial [Anneissia japonica]|uniref:uncharacterized protein LOC117105940 n=1 Tax=Anneissia japonica TaxID=1529436 RepID=UPI0014259833
MLSLVVGQMLLSYTIRFNPNETIKYVDFTSLYPFVNKVGIYPIGHPIIITEHFKDITEYEGVIKCKVLPPKGLYHPVLPYRASGRLMFPLCSKCCESLVQSPCEHSDDDRALEGTWVTLELIKALNKGYRVLKIFEVWHFENTLVYDPVTKDGGLFTAYVNAFLKLKQEASDWPSWCKTKEQRDTYVQLYFEKKGIVLNPHNIKKNPGLRALAKLMLNSFWGKFGQRPNMTKTTYIDDPEEYLEMMTHDDTEVHNVNFVNDQMVEVQWQQTKDFVEPSGRTNVIIAAYTSAQTRLKLYEHLEQLDRRVLYYDTDSVIYVSREGQWEPHIGDFLGELTDELESDNHIVTFVSGGPNNYSYKLAKPDRNGNLTHCKVRGIRLNYRNDCLVNFGSMLKMVQGEGPKKIQVTDPYKI